MKNVIYNDITYDRLYYKDEKSLTKVSVIPEEIWTKFCEKKLEHVNSPIEYRNITEEDRKIYSIDKGYTLYEKKSIITLPYLNGYKTLYQTKFEDSYTTEDILLLLKKNLEILKNIHQKGISHSDIQPHNIMINQNKDIEFIDFDSLIIDDYISDENVFFEEDDKLEEKIKRTKIMDKVELFDLYFSYLARGNFKNSGKFKISDLELDGIHKQAIYDFHHDKNTPEDYYYFDFIDDLISEEYQAPVVYAKNLFHKYSK